MTVRTRGVLFLCVANSARSQMAEGIARAIAPAGVAVFSAGSEPSTVNPYAVRAMKEVGIDIASARSKPIDEVPLDRVGLVVTLCAEQVCPTLPGAVERQHWPLEDPAAVEGPDEAVLSEFRRVRDELRERISGLF